MREIVSKVQSMRKDAGFNVTDHIEVYQTAVKGWRRCSGETSPPSFMMCWERPAIMESWKVIPLNGMSTVKKPALV